VDSIAIDKRTASTDGDRA